jgi:hypothetical protein
MNLIHHLESAAIAKEIMAREHAIHMPPKRYAARSDAGRPTFMPSRLR